MKKILLIFPLIFLLACSVQKRKYQKGFYVSTQHHKKDNTTSNLKKEIKTEKLVLNPASLVTNVNEAGLLSVSASNKPAIFNSIKIKKSLKLNPDSLCDNITLKNGDDVAAKVLEITPTEIKYKKCNLVDGPLYVVKKTDVFMVKYANGTKEIFKQENTTSVQDQANQPNNSNNSTYRGPKKTHAYAILSIIFAVLGIVTYGLLSALAIIFANLALKKIKENPNLYKGEWLAKVGKGIGIATLVIITLILIIGFAAIAGII